jgi:CspA family cold shock protein
MRQPILVLTNLGGIAGCTFWFLLREVLGGMEMTNGVVKWFSPKKGYGFITLTDGQEVFVHYSAIDGQGFRSLDQGEEVSFEVAQGPKGLQAAKVLRR